MPPRHGKSYISTQLFPAYYLYKQPSHNVAVIGYNRDYVTTHSLEAKQFYDNLTETSFNQRQAAKLHWQTAQKGSFYGESINSGITGKGFNLAVIDDPIKGMKEALNARYRKELQEWYTGTFLDRLSPDNKMVLINTRWHQDDLTGWLLHQEREAPDYAKEGWEVISLPAIKPEKPPEYPADVHIHPDPRNVGEALCPERYDLQQLRKKKHNQGKFRWNAKWQQTPVAEGGNIWKSEWFTITDEIPDDLIDVGYDYDLALTDKEENSASAYVRSGKTKDGKIYILEVDHVHYEFPQMVRWIRSNNGPHYIEDKASGKPAIQMLKQDGIHAEPVSVQGDKYSRGKVMTHLAERGDIYLTEQAADVLLFDPKQNILEFPNGRRDDVPDAFHQSLHRLHEEDKKKKTVGALPMPDIF